MKIISQLSVFDYSEIEILGDLERCKLLIDIYKIIYIKYIKCYNMLYKKGGYYEII